MRYSRRTLNYPERIALYNIREIFFNHVAIGVETPRINNRYSLEKEFTELICMKSLNGIIRNW